MDRIKSLHRQKALLESQYSLPDEKYPSSIRPVSQEYGHWIHLATPYLNGKLELDWKQANRLGLIAYNLMLKAVQK